MPSSPSSKPLGSLSTASLILPALILGIAGACPTLAAAPAEAFRWRDFLAPFHSVVLHYPIAFFTLLILIELYLLWRPSEHLQRVSRAVLWLSLISSIVTSALGLARAGGEGYDPDTLAQHKWYGIAVIAFAALIVFLQSGAFAPGPRRGWMFAYRSMLALTFAVLIAAGHLGGNLTHGSNYLTRHAPPSIRTLFEESPTRATQASAPAPSGTATDLFTSRIVPILEAKCVKCHGAEKHKGDYRVDTYEFTLKAGESGKPAIVPGDPSKSYFVHLILLPQDADDVMPPSGKGTLSDAEVMTLVRWIQAGAPGPATPSAPASEKGRDTPKASPAGKSP